eukprot:CAMPEP_0194370788 /NCGR_PEP_ID=MMETSP0174-20130528/19138_1 /TAXON_ID=216777 /ORGANISM="Proboscia alata, Strain PI-D3" /LENGTH=51 /DNA_ID=CAMNT_0039148469 /DNA_START=79 /DNA_END=230 /DNA_ORIENTATION=+
MLKRDATVRIFAYRIAGVSSRSSLQSGRWIPVISRSSATNAADGMRSSNSS